ncbi:MAG: 1-acyl-sn-glycerol-3-phosphate acyltransferase [Deltaproteobacteria bacterium]|nr:1-acyl-sn-glycerol-3-phosphate acyltransferase [Deltaproteobacteria bacterium]
MTNESDSVEKKLPAAVANTIRQFMSAGFLDRWAAATQEQLQAPARQFDPEFMKKLVPKMDTFMSYFDAEVRGMERVPKSPVLLIGNHSGGTITPDTSAVYAAWYRTRGFNDPLLGLAFDAIFAVPKWGELMRKIGQMPASMDNAGSALADGCSVLLYPGGTYEVFRPWKERNKILFKGRKGFIRLALKAGVPVVPVVGHGGHETTIVLTRGERLAKMMGSDKVRMGGAPLLFQLPWGLSTPATPGIPLPAKITVQVCEPVDWSEYGPDAADDPEVLQRCYDEITSLMQSTLDQLAAENPRPIAARLKKVLRR